MKKIALLSVFVIIIGVIFTSILITVYSGENKISGVYEGTLPSYNDYLTKKMDFNKKSR